PTPWCSARPLGRWTCATPTTGGLTSPVPIGGIRAGRAVPCRACGNTRWCTWRSRTRRRTRSGPAKSCRPKPSGSSRPAADWKARPTSGARSTCRAASRWPTTWQGEFPHQNLLEDGFEWTAPVGSFPPNGYGLHEMAGNVWEWTTDWYQEHGKIQHACCTLDDPRGGQPEESCDPRTPEIRIPRRVMKGGSYLCAPNYCQRYRPAARMAQPIDTSTCHLG